jgi:xanthine/CO dehydrogenase XdhC/CoxF family maturation factor
MTVEPRMTLLDALRDELGLTGTKKGCDRGECGACTVQIEGRRVLSCMTLAAMKNGKRVTTIEGLERDGQLHAVQAAFIEVVEPPVPLVIFGAGADVVPLVTIAQRLGWRPTVVDTHARARSLECFADAEDVILCRPEDVASRVPLMESSAVVVMTHNYFHDREVLNVLLNERLRYVGCLGPKRRTERLLSELRDATDAPTTPWLGRLHAPIGIDIGAETSAEIALAIAAEILGVLRGRSGGSLHARQDAIHASAPTLANEHALPILDVSRPTTVASRAANAS